MSLMRGLLRRIFRSFVLFSNSIIQNIVDVHVALSVNCYVLQLMVLSSAVRVSDLHAALPIRFGSSQIFNEL